MDFGAVPPEINSARVHSGPGSGPMMAAAAAWKSSPPNWTHGGLLLFGDFGAHRRGVAGARVDIDGGGGRNLCRVDEHSAAQAEQAAAQAKAAASASEAAFAMTVPPPLIAANRGRRLALVATNILGKTPRRSRPAKRITPKWGSGQRRNARLCRPSAAASRVDAVHFAAADHQPVRTRGPGRHGSASRRAAVEPL